MKYLWLVALTAAGILYWQYRVERARADECQRAKQPTKQLVTDLQDGMKRAEQLKPSESAAALNQWLSERYSW